MPTQAPTTGPNPVRLLLGLLLVLPALVALVVSQFLPSVWTFLASFQDISPFRGERGGSTYVGLEHWGRVLPELVPALGFAFALGLLPLVVALVVGPTLAYVAQAGGRAARWGVRVGLALPMVSFAPLALAVAARWADLESRALADPDTATWAIVSALFLSTVGLVCGVATTLFLAAARRRPDGRSTASAAVAVSVLLALGILSAAIQSFTFPFALTGGGPANATLTPMLLAYRHGFQRMDIGSGAAVDTVVLSLLFLFGLVATIVVIATRLRAAQDVPPTPTRTTPTILAYGGTLLVLVVSLVGLWPLLSRLANPVPDDGMATIPRTLLAQVPPALAGVLLAALAAFGIAVLRPFGRWSELLLLPFGPWLFVGTGPLVLAYFFSGDPDDLRIGSPFWIAVPALFALTIVFRGLAERPPAAIALGALPATGIALVVTWVGSTQDLIYQLVVDREQLTSQVWFASLMSQAVTTNDGPPLGVLLPLPLLVVLAVLLIVVQLGYVDRLALRVGGSSTGRDTSAPPSAS